jgi:methionine-rich copper-binding protein CopC
MPIFAEPPSIDMTAPTVSSFSPTDEAANIAIASNIIVTFSETVVQGTGSIILKTAAGTTVATYDAASSSNLSISGSTLTINPSADLAYSTGYRLEFATGTVKDLAGNVYAGTTSYNFTTLQTFTGTNSNESFSSGIGNDDINGGQGTDTVLYNINRSNFTVTKNSNGYTVTDNTGAAGTDTLTNIERLQFSDMSLALDINGNAGQSYRLYQAAFNRTPDNGGLKYWIGIMDSGISLQDVSSAFLLSNEFKTLYGASPTNGEFVNRLYSNVLHRAPDQGGYNYWVGLLDNHQINARDTLINFSESNENQLALIGVIQDGIPLYP